MLYAFFWVILRRLNFICQRFGTLCLFHLHTHLPMEMEQCSEMSAYKIQMLGNYPEESIQHLKTVTRICGSKVAPGHTMTAYWGSRGTAPIISNLDTRCRLLVSFMLQAFLLRDNLNVLALSEANSRTIHPHSINGRCRCAQKRNQDVILSLEDTSELSAK